MAPLCYNRHLAAEAMAKMRLSPQGQTPGLVGVTVMAFGYAPDPSLSDGDAFMTYVRAGCPTILIPTFRSPVGVRRVREILEILEGVFIQDEGPD